MDLFQLKYFVCVAEQGSFSKAALLLEVAQTTLSRQVRALEVELRTHLFHRNGRGAQLTPAGRRLLDHARGLLRSADAARDAVRQGDTGLQGRVVIGLSPGVSKLLIPPLVSAFRTTLPRVSLSIVEGLSDRLFDQLVTGRLDFAIARNPARCPHVVVELLATEGIYLVGVEPVLKAKASVPISALKGLPLILPSAPHAIRPLLDAAMARLGSRPNVAVEVDAVGFDSLTELAALGLGYALVPEGTIELFSEGRKLSCQKIDAPDFFINLCLIAPSQEPPSQVPVEGLRLTRQVILELLRPTSDPL
ncbi:LysR family transcriptional regulator [Pusillimonas sp.]|uniref:LysR family transcriptional regulator n=1 Tax=Pusillimonas sp. TaxID=3040095 RepID=UPI0029B03DAC|nr:LysR family transcriptional regulator [Pusillimonas sp.]MDX3895579.1 LysR family transcriptional regulator [Pusillimonas sp.]